MEPISEKVKRLMADVEAERISLEDALKNLTDAELSMIAARWMAELDAARERRRRRMPPGD